MADRHWHSVACKLEKEKLDLLQGAKARTGDCNVLLCCHSDHTCFKERFNACSDGLDNATQISTPHEAETAQDKTVVVFHKTDVRLHSDLLLSMSLALNFFKEQPTLHYHNSRTHCCTSVPSSSFLFL
jgi:hypothetical protein